MCTLCHTSCLEPCSVNWTDWFPATVSPEFPPSPLVSPLPPPTNEAYRCTFDPPVLLRQFILPSKYFVSPELTRVGDFEHHFDSFTIVLTVGPFLCWYKHTA